MTTNALKGWIYSHYGSYQDMARELDVSTSTVSSWAHTQPRNMMKFMPEIMKYTGETAEAVVEVVMKREGEIYGRS